MKIFLYASTVLYLILFASCGNKSVMDDIDTKAKELVVTDTAMTPIFIIKPEAEEPKAKRLA